MQVTETERKGSVDLLTTPKSIHRKLYRYLQGESREANFKRLSVNITALESAVYNLYSDNSPRYKDLIGRISIASSASENGFIVSEYFNPDFDPTAFLNLGEIGWNPTVSEPIRREIEKGEKKRDIGTFVVPSNDTRCRQCNSNKITVQTKQTLASDEDSVALFVCVKCGHEWRKFEGL